MKKNILYFLSALIVVNLTSCENAHNEHKNEDTSNQTSIKKLIQFRKK